MSDRVHLERFFLSLLDMSKSGCTLEQPQLTQDLVRTIRNRNWFNLASPTDREFGKIWWCKP